MSSSADRPHPRSSLSLGKMVSGWSKLLAGRKPLLSIEITRECPLSCPGCYAYGDQNLGGGVTLRQLGDLRGDALVDGVLRLVDEHRPMHVSFVGGEPLIRHRELSRILPEMSRRGVFSLVVTSGVIRFPREWNEIPRVRVAVSVDGLPPEHDQRRAPATYQRILANLERRRADISWVVTNPMLKRDGYLDEYVAFWTGRPEIERVWLSLYTPQKGEESDERITPESRARFARALPGLKAKYPDLVLSGSNVEAFMNPPPHPAKCTFARIQTSYSADLQTRVRPCFYGGDPECAECGCAVSAALHWLQDQEVPYGLGIKAGHLIDASLAIGDGIRAMRRLLEDRRGPIFPHSLISGERPARARPNRNGEDRERPIRRVRSQVGSVRTARSLLSPSRGGGDGEGPAPEESRSRSAPPS